MANDSFIKNVNALAINIEVIKESLDLFDEETVVQLENLASLDVSLITQDLNKGNYLGNRKTDIDLALNNLSTTEEVTYHRVTLTLNTGVVIPIDFTTLNEAQEIVIEEVSSYTAFYTKLTEGIAEYNANEVDAQKHVVNHEIDVINETIEALPTLLRIRDTDGSACNIDRVVLSVYGGGSPIETAPAYYWTKTTSALEVLANRVGDIIALGENIDKIIALADKEDEVQYLYDVRVNLQSLYDNLQKIIDVEASLVAINTVNESKTSIDTVNANITNIDAVASNETNITAVADNEVNITAVADNETNINAVNANKINIDAVVANEADIDAVALNISDVTAVNTNKTNIDAVALNETNINAVNANKTNIDAVVANEADIDAVALNMQAILDSETYAQTATDKATEAGGFATDAMGYRDELTALNVNAVQLVSSATAYTSYDSNNGLLTIGIPQGEKGDIGEAFDVDAVGTIANRTNYDGASKGFSYLSSDEDPTLIYFKISDTSGDWSVGTPFGKGDDGDPGDPGNGILTVIRTAGNGSAGTTDTYTITFADTSTTTFDVYNGADGAGAGDMLKSTYDTTENGVVDNAEKVNNLTVQTAVPAGAIFTDTQATINDTLTSTSTVEALSASRGKVLQDTKQPITASSYNQLADASLGSGTHTFNFGNGDMQQLTVTGDITLAFSGFVAGKVCTMIVDLVNAGSWTLTYPAGIIFADKTAPTYTATGTDRVMIVKDKDNVYSLFVIGQDVGGV